VTRPARLLAALLALGLCACTARYSQTLVGTIERARSRPVTNSSEGAGLTAQPGALGGAYGIPGPPEYPFNEAAPEPAAELAEPSCESVMTMVDYRSVWVYIPLAIPLYYVQPRITTTTFCVAK
jgi:hypothetical protein